jgi:kynureninase
LRIIESKDEIKISSEEIINSCSENTALVVLSHVVFKSAYKYDIPLITKELKKKGAYVIWDLSHSVGSVPIHLNKWNCDFAVGCTYKYLNGGPGSPAFLYVNKNLINDSQNPIWGWFGANNPFNFDLSFTESSSIEKFNVGTQPMISLSALESSLQITIEAGMENIREKNILLTDYLIFLIRENLREYNIEIGTPLNSKERGSHITLKHKEGYRICKAMIENKGLKIIPDFRKPDNIRFGLNSLYNSFEEIFIAVKRIKEILDTNEFENFDLEFDAVT